MSSYPREARLARLDAARGGISGAPGQGTLFPERWRSVREHTAARRSASM